MSVRSNLIEKIETHQDILKERVRDAKTCMASRDFDRAIVALIDANFHQAMVDELKSVKP